MFNFFSRKSTEPVPLCVKTDMHCHIIPGVDDGSPDVDTSVELVERMQQWGIERIIASPHITDVTFMNSRENLTPACTQLVTAISSRGINIDISHAAENRIDNLMLKNFEEGSLIAYPNDWLLIENSFLQEPANLESLVFELQMKGYRPILAHPERYFYYSQHKSRLEKLHSAGLYFQINILSLAGSYSNAERKIAQWLMEKELVDFVGTDLHNFRHADQIDAYLRTSSGKREMETLREMVLNDTAFN